MSFESEIKGLGCKILEQEPMSRHTTFRIGGPAQYHVMPESIAQLKQIVSICRQYEIPCFIMGNGSNLLCADDGVEVNGVEIRVD